MKRFLILFLILAVSFTGFSQKTVVNRETMLRYGYNPAEQDSMFFEAVIETYSDGTQGYKEEPVRDTAQLVDKITTSAINIAKGHLPAVNGVWQFPATVDGILQANSLLNQFGTSVFEQVVDRYRNLVDSTTWDISTPQGTVEGLITVHPNGQQFRLTVGGGNYNMLAVGDALFRVINYPSQGQSTDFFRLLNVGFLEFRTLVYSENGAGAVASGIRLRKQN